MLKIGTKAPAFSLLNQDGKTVSLSDFSGQWVVLYFYPKAQTPGCIVQACGLRDSQKELEELNAVAIGISADKQALLKKFEDKQNLNFTLLGDKEKETIQAYEAWGEKKFMGKTFNGIFRITYIINPQGEIAHTIEKVKTKTHHETVVEWLKENAS